MAEEILNNDPLGILSKKQAETSSPDPLGILKKKEPTVLGSSVTPSPSQDKFNLAPAKKDKYQQGLQYAQEGFKMPTAADKQELKQQGWLMNTVSALDKGFYKNLVGNPVKGLGTLLQGTTKKVMGGTGEGFVSDALIKFGDYFNNAIDELAPQDEEYKNSLSDQVAQAFGQVGSMVLTGAAAGMGQKATGLAAATEVPKATAAINAAKGFGKDLINPVSVSAGLSMGQSEFDKAKQFGASDDQAFEAFYKNAAVGSILEQIPTMQFLKRFNNATTGGVANYIKTKGVAGITGGIEELTTEVLQQLYANKTAKDIYNVNQKLFEGVAESGGVGFGVGFLLNAMGASAKILKKQGKREDAKVVENQMKTFESKMEAESKEEEKKTKAAVIMPEENIAPEVVDQNRPTKPAVIMPEENVPAETITISPEEKASNENVIKYNETKSFKKKKQIVKEQLGELSEEDNAIVDNLNKEDLDKIANSNFDLETFKNIKNAVQESSTESILQYPQEGIGETGGERRGVEPSVQGETITIEGEESQPQGVKEETAKDVTGVTHAETNAVAAQLGLPAYESNPETFDDWDAEATKRINEDKNTIPDLLKKLENKEMPSPVEQRIMAKYLASLKSKIDADPANNNLISEYKKARDLSDTIGGTKVAQSLAARKPLERVVDSIGDYMLEEMEKSGVDQLTDQQKETAIKEFNEIKKAKEDAEAKLTILEEENKKLKAQQEIVKARKQKASQKTKEQFAKERESLKESIKDKWSKASKDNTLTAVPLPYAKQLAAIAPDVARLVRNYAAEGITNLNEVIKKIKEDIGDFIPEITEKDINDLIAGEYNKKRETKNELNARIKDIKDEAKLVSELDRLMNGEQPKQEKEKIKRNQRITELKKQISDLKKKYGFYDESNLKSLASKYNKEIADLEKRIKEGDFDKEEKKIPLLSNTEVKKRFPEQFKQAEEAKRKLDELKNERKVRLLKQEYARRSKLEKIKDFGLEVLNLPRTIMSSMDFSAPLRQGVIVTVSHPVTASKAAKTMFEHALSQESFDNWFTDLRETNAYKIMEKSGLYVADPHDPRLSTKEDAFMNNMAEKIPVVGRMIKGSERAYVSYLNKMRVDLFNQFADDLENQGKTFENSPDLYKGIASFVNNATGRGSIGNLENAAPILNAAFFSPRLIASRLNILGLSDIATGGQGFYGKLPKEVRIMALKDIMKFIGVGMAVLALAKLNGGDVEDDPRSSNFGKIVIGNKHYDIWGGFQQYVRLISQIASGEIKQPKTGKIKKLGDTKSPFGKTRMDVIASFFRGKLAPIPSATVDYLSGRTAVGEKTTLKGELESHLTPLIYSDVKEAYKDEGVKAIFTVGLPASFGIGVQTYDAKKKK